MRIAIVCLPLLLAACGGGAPAAPFTESKGRVITLKEECQITGGETKGAGPRGKCNDIMPKARTIENRGTEVRRKLTVKYAYTAQDGQFYEGTGEIDQTLSSRVPRVGEDIPVWIDPGNPGASRPNN